MSDLETHLRASLTGPLWEKIGIRPHHGINLYLPALHSALSAGIGEFLDLLPMIDWCQSLGWDVIQLLPLNHADQDPSPYNASSSCAINFIHLSLHALPYLDELPEQKEKIETLKSLTKTQRIAYEQVLTQKLVWLRTYFEAVGTRIASLPEFQQFMIDQPWVEPYALFRSLKDELGSLPWMAWASELRSPSPEEYPRLIALYHSRVSFYSVLQYLCHQQLKTVHEYASLRGVLLMGDIPILLNPDSADVWQHPEYFDINLAAGAPPDPYNEEGQYWGFPLFRWDVMRKDGFSWWKQRLNYAAHFFDLYRLDHVIGFFRIWTIPLGHSSKEGYFLPREESVWESQGRELLTILATSAPMLPIAEDLGTVPPIVRPILDEMGICGTKVVRWMRDWEKEKQFIPKEAYPPISLTCLSTHDSSTLQQWWTEAPEDAAMLASSKHWTYTPNLSAEHRQIILRDSHQTASLFHINLLQEYLALFPELVWPDPNDERINIPGKILPTNWTYRFRPSVEEIISHAPLTRFMQSLCFGGLGIP